MKRWHIISVVVASYIFFMLAGIPANQVMRYLKQQENFTLQVTGVSGSIWNGQAKHLQIPGKPALENISWSINPLALLIARLSADVSAQLNKHPLQGHISRSIFGDELHASDITTSLPASEIQSLLDIPFGELSGDMEIHLDELNLQKDLMPQIQARIFWQHAQLTLGQTLAMGLVNVTISSDDARQTSIVINNQGGDLNLQGQIQIGTDYGYVLQLDLKPKDAIGEVAQSLGQFAQRQADGTYRLKQNGNLRQLGF